VNTPRTKDPAAREFLAAESVIHLDELVVLPMDKVQPKEGIVS
jgi:hypothetical protein